MADDVTQDRITVKVRGLAYTFRVPSIQYETEIGYKTNDILARGMPQGLSPQAMMLGSGQQAYSSAWSRAVMELYLVQADDPWPFTGGPGRVESDRFPLSRHRLVQEIGGAFGDALNRFLDDGAADGNAAGQEAVAGQQDPG